MTSPPPPSRRAWDQVRAVLVAVHVVAVVGMSFPSPEGLSAAQLAQPKARVQLAPWVAAAARVGVTRDAFVGGILAGGRALERVEDAAERIFAPYARYAGVKQSWRMFSSSPAGSSRLEMWIAEGGVWRRIYAPFDPDAQWRAALWEDGRVRGCLKSLGGARYTGWWAAFAKSAARRAAADFPAADTFRVQRVPLRFPPPDELAASGRLAELDPVGIVDVELAPLRGVAP